MKQCSISSMRKFGIMVQISRQFCQEHKNNMINQYFLSPLTIYAL